MGEDPDRIRAEIEQTRAEMGETVDALGYKTDVKARAKDSIQDKKESVMGVASSAKERLVGAGQSVGDATPDTEQVKQQARRAKSVAQENPLGLAVGAVAVGFLAGMLIPSTRVEDEKLGEISDDVIDRAKETGQEALERGKQVAQDAAETAKDSGREHAEELKSTAQDHAQDGRPRRTRGVRAPSRSALRLEPAGEGEGLLVQRRRLEVAVGGDDRGFDVVEARGRGPPRRSAPAVVASQANSRAA